MKCICCPMIQSFYLLLVTLSLPSVCSAGLLDNLDISIPSLGSLSGNDKPAITSSLKDAVTEVPFLDDFSPTNFVSLADLPRGPNNGFILNRPGLFEFRAKSYCLHAGTYGPSKGYGYSYAPLAGPRAGIIQRIAQQSVVHPEIDQHDIQILIWSILAKCKISDIEPEYQHVAKALLSDKDITTLNGGSLSVLPDSVRNKIMDKLSDSMRPIFEAESNIRSKLTIGGSTFDEVERIAVLTGDHPLGKGSREVPEGRWSYKPDGFFIRYFPKGYSQTLMQLYVPEQFTIERDSQGRIILLADRRGNLVELVYDDTASLGGLSGDSNTKACAFSTIRFVQTRYIGPEFMRKSEVKFANLGWTLVGNPNGKASTSGAQTRFSDLAKRYSDAQKLSEWLVDFAKTAGKLAGKKNFKPGSPGTDLIDVAHLSVAVKAALAGSGKSWPDWVPDHSLMPQKVWQSELCKFVGAPSPYVASAGTLVASVNLVGILAINEDDDPCSGSRNRGGREYDPSSDTAEPGNTSDQRLLQSAAGSGGTPAERNRMRNRLRELELIRDTFRNTQPNQGEDAVDYYERVKNILGYDESRGSVAPMWTDPFSCNIGVREDLYTDEPAISRSSDCAHERSHQSRCRWARDNAAGGYPSWTMDAGNLRADEMTAYQAGIDALNDWLNQNPGSE